MISEQLIHPKYRRDIDGLRAIAVLAVVGFHAAPGRITGGFIGVDIFFVISGYLITTIIINNLDKESFSFVEFYRRRIRRIFPALLVVLVTSHVFGSFLLTAEEYESLGKHIAGGAGFYSNFLLWMESGYFDSASDMKPMLHLWSLSIEEQFYIVWPLLLWFIFTNKIGYLVTMIVIVLLSFSLNVYTARDDTVFAFYSPLARSWELLSGAVLAYIFLRKTNYSLNQHDMLINTISFVGAAFIVTGLFLIDENSAFPGWWAVLPVLGTVLMILAGSQAWINSVILSNRFFVWFGLISYPLYLTHWPLLSFLRIMESGEIEQVNRVYAVLISIGLSWMIYNFIEKPIRFGAYSRFKITVLVATMVIVGFYGFYIYVQTGFVPRIGSQPYVVNNGDIGQRKFFEYMDERFHLCTPIDIQNETGYWEEYKRCYQSQEDEHIQVAIIGDSHAEHLFIGLSEALTGFNVVYFAKGGLPFLSNTNYEGIFHHLLGDKDIKVVMVAAHWSRDLRGIEREQLEAEFNRLIESLIDANKKVYIVDDIPQFKFKPSKCKYAGRLGRENKCRQDIEITKKERMDYYSIFSTVTEKYPDINIIDTTGFFCDSNYCSMSRDGILFYRDDHHLNINGSQGLGRYIIQNNPVIQDIRYLIEK